MAAPNGNEFWKLRSKHGRDKIFSTPEILWEAACEYFSWCETNPLLETKAFSSNGEILTTTIPKMRAFTFDGLYLFLGCTLEGYREYKNRHEYSEVLARIAQVIRKQKFEGAAADMLNANIIARDLGMVEKSQTTHAGDPDNPIQTNNVHRVVFEDNTKD